MPRLAAAGREERACDPAAESEEPAAPPAELAVGQTSDDIVVCARERWNETGFRVVEGQLYRLGAWGEWRDRDIVAGPEGYTTEQALARGATALVFNPLTEALRRVPEENWFALVCMIDHETDTLVVVAGERTWVAPATGLLGCFANDIFPMYFNNSGFVRLRVTRTR